MRGSASTKGLVLLKLNGSPNQSGMGLLITLLALSVFSLLGLYMMLNATTGMHISDNYEAQIQATYAAQAGLNHARVLIRGLDFNSLLQGPDGTYDGNPAYLSLARTYIFRNPISLRVAQSLSIYDPNGDVTGIPDDGLISTGVRGGTPGTVLIPGIGISQTMPKPNGAGEIVTSRYFVKVTDNNGEASELKGDPDDNPFLDGDGTIIVRSMGLAQTVPDITGRVLRRNSLAIYEGRYKRLSAFNLGPALAVQGARVHASFDGDYEISGGLFPGIGTIDTDTGDGVFPDQIIGSAAGESESITGAGLPTPSIQDITVRVGENPDYSMLFDPDYLWNFIHDQVQQSADDVYEGNQNWVGGISPYAGHYDASDSWNAPEQDPRFIVVKGDLHVAGRFSGGGLLIVTGSFSYEDSFTYNGLIVVVGSGDVSAGGSDSRITGGLFVANLSRVAGRIEFGTSNISISGNSRIESSKNAVEMALGLISPIQVGFREIAGSDP